jgi:uncharacterized protein (DUF4415 family)
MRTSKATKDKPDWAFIDATTEEEIARHMIEDNSPEWTDEMFDRAEYRIGDKVIRRGRPPLDTPKQQVTLRLDQDVIAHFRSAGPGWQSRINAALREAIERAQGVPGGE